MKALATIIAALALIGGWASLSVADAQIIQDEEEPYLAAENNYQWNNPWLSQWRIYETEEELEPAIHSLIKFLLGRDHEIHYIDCRERELEGKPANTSGMFTRTGGRGSLDYICLTRFSGGWVHAPTLLHVIAHAIQYQLAYADYLEHDKGHGYAFGLSLNYVYHSLFGVNLDHYCGYNGRGCDWRVERFKSFKWSPRS